MKADLQRRIQRYGWDKAAAYYENSWQAQLKPAHDLLMEGSDVQTGEHVLELAAGTGLVTFRLAELTGPDGIIEATDISDEMVKIGSELAKANDMLHVTFKRMDAEKLDYPDAAFDLVSCALGMMYLPEPENSLKEAYRVLKPGGRLVSAVWGSRRKCGWAEIFPIVDSRVNTDVCPMFFNLGEGEVIKRAFQEAGFQEVTSIKIETTLRYDTAEEACEASFLGGPVAMAYARFDDDTKKEAREEYILSIAPFKVGNGYEIPGEFVVCKGIKP